MKTSVRHKDTWPLCKFDIVSLPLRHHGKKHRHFDEWFCLTIESCSKGINVNSQNNYRYYYST